MSDSDDSDYGPAIVIDFGADTVQVGFSGDDDPRVVLPAFISPDGQYPGDVKYRISMNDMKYPMTAQEKDWEGIEKIVQFAYEKKLKLSSRDQSVLWSQSIFEKTEDKLELAEMLFEKLGSASYYPAPQPVLASYASGRGSGLFIDSGHTHTQVVMIYEGYLIEESCFKVEIGGHHLTQQLQSLIELQSSRQLLSWEICRDIKNNHSYCGVNDDVDEGIYTLPDAQQIDVSNAVGKCTEPLFNFSLFNQDVNSNGYTSIQDMIFKSIMNADVDLRSHMFCNIIMTGGNTLINGYRDHLQSLIKPMAMTKVSKVVAAPERLYSVWIGGSILSSLSMFQNQWITKQEYEECGPNIVLGLTKPQNLFQSVL